MKKKYAVLLISFLSAAAAVLGVLAWDSSRRAEKYELYLSNGSRHAFSELVTAVGEMDTALQKSVYVSSPGLRSAVCTELFGKAMTAQMSLGSLPAASPELEQLSGFISRVGDYAFCLSSMEAEEAAEAEENLRLLAQSSSVLAENLRGLERELFEGRLSMDELYESRLPLSLGEGEETLPTLGDSLRLIEREFPEIPALIYDGPFSQHLSETSPAMLEGLEEIDENRGREIAAGFLRMGKTRVYPAGECKGEIPCIYYAARLSDDEQVTVAVTKQGGLVLGMLHSRYVRETLIEIPRALDAAEEFLRAKGYADMMQTYYMLQGGVLTVNYACLQQGVVCYPDLIKVSVAMDTGRICGFEATGYISSHRERQLPEAAVSPEQAVLALPEGLEHREPRPVLIPSAGGEELLCWEFLCTGQEGEKCLIYVSALSGQQEKILLLLEDENGSLTI